MSVAGAAAGVSGRPATHAAVPLSTGPDADAAVALAARVDPREVAVAVVERPRVDASEVQIGVDGADDCAQSHQHEQHDHHRRQHLMTSYQLTTPTSRSTGRARRLPTNIHVSQAKKS